MGLITRAVSPQKLDAEVALTLKLLAAKSPIGMKLGKEAFYAMADMPFEDALDFLSQKIAEVAATEDAKEGITAFLEKRQPVFEPLQAFCLWGFCFSVSSICRRFLLLA